MRPRALGTNKNDASSRLLDQVLQRWFEITVAGNENQRIPSTSGVRCKKLARERNVDANLFSLNDKRTSTIVLPSAIA